MSKEFYVCNTLKVVTKRVSLAINFLFIYFGERRTPRDMHLQYQDIFKQHSLLPSSRATPRAVLQR